MFLYQFYFLFIDQANHATVCIYSIIVGLALPRKSVQLKAPITLLEKLLIVYALRCIKVFVAKVGLHFSAQKKI